MNIHKVIKEEIIQYIKEEDYFNTTLPDDVKRLSNRYIGRNVIWYGDPDQMIVLDKNQVHGMWGNVYDKEKLEYVKNMILHSEDYVEFECAYGMGNIVDLQDIKEHQESYLADTFYGDYDGFDEPYSTGDETLDTYVGTEDINQQEFINGYYIDRPEIIGFFEEHKYDLVYNTNTNESLLNIYKQLNPDDAELSAFEEFITLEENLKEAFNQKQGDIGRFMVQLRDGHHRVMGAIAAGENYVCVNLAKDELSRFANDINRVTTKGDV